MVIQIHGKRDIYMSESQNDRRHDEQMNSQKYRGLLKQKLEAELRKVDVNGQAVFQQDLLLVMCQRS